MSEGLHGTATARDVAYCYRVFLGREAENETVIADKVGQPRTDVMAAFVTSGEFGSQVLYRLIDGLPPATPLHDQPADDGVAAWFDDFFGADAERAQRLGRAGSGLAALAAAGVEPAVVALLERGFGGDATAAFGGALQAGAADILRQSAPADVALTLRCGPMLLGAVPRTAAGAAREGSGTDVWDFGLADFARLSRLDDFAIVAAPRAGAGIVHRLAVPRPAGVPDPLASRRALRPGLALVDLWFAGRCELALRFEGDGAALTLDAYQCRIGEQPIKLVAAAPIGGAIAIAAVRLLNPLAPVLLVIRDAAGVIRSFDHIPFPSLARGGLHAAERAICGHGGDDVADMAALSAELLGLLLRRDAHVARTVATIVVDAAANTGAEPIFDADLCDYLATFLGVAVTGAGADRVVPETVREGAALLLPAGAVPTLSALIRPLPSPVAAQTVTGSVGIVDWDRQGEIHSVWMPPLGEWLDDLQWRGAPRIAPMLRVGEGGPAALGFGWPLALAVRPAPVAQGNRSPFEIAAEIDLPLLRGATAGPAPAIDIVVLSDAVRALPIPLLESIARQHGLGDGGRMLLCRAGGLMAPSVAEALEGLFPGRHRIVEARAGAGRLEQLAAARPDLVADLVLIVDAATLLTDARTVATLAAMMSAGEVMTAGCLIRTVAGDRRIASHGGYVLTHADLRMTPSLGFSPADIETLGGPVTLPVAANTMAAMIARRNLIDGLPVYGTDGGAPAEDDIRLGLAALAAGGLNLCTSVVSAHSERPAPHRQLIGRVLPYRLDAATIDRLVNSTAVIQKIR